MNNKMFCILGWCVHIHISFGEDDCAAERAGEADERVGIDKTDRVLQTRGGPGKGRRRRSVLRCFGDLSCLRTRVGTRCTTTCEIA